MPYFRAVACNASVACDIPLLDHPYFRDLPEPETLGPFLPPETWGDRLHRAYRLARARNGAGFTYRAVAERISEHEPTTDVAILRLEGRPKAPEHPRGRRLALYCVCLYGIDPADFGFNGVHFRPATWNRARILWEGREAGWAIAGRRP